MTDPRRSLPAVDRLLRLPPVAALAAAHPRTVVARAVREAIARARSEPGSAPRDEAGWVAAVTEHCEALLAPTLRRCVNATGVVLHTNLGRAPLADAAIAALTATAQGYSSLEYDLASGARGSRHVHCAALLTELTGAEDAMVVNNAASALVLALATAAEDAGVVVSRGELIEIGGGFRIPEILNASGAHLVEVGTTNRTRAADYEHALRKKKGLGTGDRGPRAILKVHRSNFRLEGFTAEASLPELVALGRARRAPVLYDLGTGLMLDLADAGLGGEPTLPAAARSGATVVIASADKLLGGPQAGLLVGTRRFISACRRHPVARAVRSDKLTLSALAATLALYRDGSLARRSIPVLRMLTAPLAELEAAARRLAAALPAAARADVVATRSAVGGGTFPGVELESRGVALRPDVAPGVLAARLRQAAMPVIGLVERSRVVLDVRTLLPGDDAAVAAAVAGALAD